MPIKLRRKRYAAIVISLLTLVFVGVGAVVSMMTLTTFRPLPFAQPNQLVQYVETEDGDPEPWESDSLAQTTRLVPELIGSAMYTMTMPMPLAFGALEKPARVVVTSPNFLKVLGLRVDRPSAAVVYANTPGTAIIARSFARSLGLTPESAPGQQIRIEERPLTIVGTFDREGAFPADGDVWYADAGRRGNVWMAVSRMSPQTNIDVVTERLTLALGVIRGGKGWSRVAPVTLAQVARPGMPSEQRSLIAGIIIFAIIAILNYGLLGVGEARRRLQEFAIRVAIGATRAQIARQVFVEQLLLILVSVAATVSLIGFAWAVVPADSAFQFPKHVPLGVWTVVAVVLALLTGAATLPMGVANSGGDVEVLRRANTAGSPFERGWNRVFIGLQFAVTAFLLVAGGIAALTLARSKRTNYGFDPSNALIGSIAYRTPSLKEDRSAKLASRQIKEALQHALPRDRVTAWSRSWRSMGGGAFRYAIDPQVAARPVGAHWTFKLGGIAAPWMSQDVMPDFFDVVGIPIIAGRAFRETDDERSEPVIILSEATAKNLWGVEDAVGKRMRFGENDGDWRRVIGVAADAYPIENLAFLRQAAAVRFAKGTAYRPLAQVIPRALNVLVKGPSVEAVAPQVRAVVARTAPGEDFTYLGSLASFLDGNRELERGEFTTNLLIGFSVGGFILALLGAIVLIDEVVRTRTSEIGIRRALGAQSASLVILASRETWIAGMAGVVAGSLVGMRAGPFVAVWMKANPMGQLLPPPTVSYALVAASAVVLLILLAVGTAARAIRAARLDPAVALRIE